MSIQQLYKYLPKKYVRSVVQEGKILFRNFSYFRKCEDPNRGDETEGVHVDDPDNDITLADPSTDRVISEGDFRAFNSVNQDKIFVFCLSQSFDETLFDPFQLDACIVIRDAEAFFRRCNQAAKRLLKIEPPGLIHRKVEYYKPNEASDLPIKDPRSLPFFKRHIYANQDEYRAVFALRGGFTLLERVARREFTFRDEIEEGISRNLTLRVGNLGSIVEVRYKKR